MSTLAAFVFEPLYSLVPAYARLLTRSLPPTARRDEIIVGFVEALSNGILHGALGISSHERDAGDVERYLDRVIRADATPPPDGARLRVMVKQRRAGNIFVEIADSGPGFDWRTTGSRQGRGLAILRGVFRSVAWNDRGNRVVLEIEGNP